MTVNRNLRKVSLRRGKRPSEEREADPATSKKNKAALIDKKKQESDLKYGFLSRKEVPTHRAHSAWSSLMRQWSRQNCFTTRRPSTVHIKKKLQPLQCFERKKCMLLMLHYCWDVEYAARLFLCLENTTVSHTMHKEHKKLLELFYFRILSLSPNSAHEDHVGTKSGWTISLLA